MIGFVKVFSESARRRAYFVFSTKDALLPAYLILILPYTLYTYAWCSIWYTMEAWHEKKHVVGSPPKLHTPKEKNWAAC